MVIRLEIKEDELVGEGDKIVILGIRRKKMESLTVYVELCPILFRKYNKLIAAVFAS